MMHKRSVPIFILSFLCLLCGCATHQEPCESGLVKLRYGDYVSSAVALEPSLILGAAHTLFDNSIDLHAVRINGKTPGSISVVADGFAIMRRNEAAAVTTIHSYSVFEDIVILETDLAFVPTTARIPDDLADAIRTARKFELITREKSTQAERRIAVKDLMYDIEHRVIGITCKETDLDRFNLSGSPLVSRDRDGTCYLLGIVSASATTAPVNDALWTNAVLVCPLDATRFKEMLP